MGEDNCGEATIELRHRLRMPDGAVKRVRTIHRANAMRRMQARTCADLVRMAEALGLDVAEARPGSYTGA